MPYGYLGVKPNQKVKNAGILDVTDAAILNKDGHLGGSWELIQTQSHSSNVTAVDFTSIEESKYDCLLYTSPSPRDGLLSRMPSSA